MARESTKLKIVREAQTRFDVSQKAAGRASNNFRKDIKFANADAYNGWQWPENVYNDRNGDDRPTLTVNITRQHNLLIENDAKRNNLCVSVKPLGFGASNSSAKAYRAYLDYMQNRSNAKLAFNHARKFQIQGGVGWFLLTTDWENPKSWSQEILIKQIYDPLSVIVDSMARAIDRSDMNFGFVFQKFSKDDFLVSKPKYKSAVGSPPLNGLEYWTNENEIILADYYRKVPKKDTLYLIKNDKGETSSMLDSEIPDNVRDKLEQYIIDSRPTEIIGVEKITIAGSTIVEDPVPIAGQHIPLFPFIGEEIFIDGQLDRKGHTRNLIDPQRMYNFWSSAAVEYGALQTKTPYTGPVETYDKHKEIWDNANTMNFSFLPYESYDENGSPLKPPERVQPPVSSPVALDGMRIALEEMQRTSGQFTAATGETDNSRTGVAGAQRASKSDLSTSHFIDNEAATLTHLGRVIISWIPTYYDTKRLYQVTFADGETAALTIDPKAQQAYLEEFGPDGKIIARILNPKLGQYEVEVVPGDNFSSRRDQAFSTFSIILTQAPQLIPIIGDILFKAADFPLSDEAAERLRRMVPPQALGTGPSETEAQLQQQVQQLTSMLEEAIKAVSTEKLKTQAAKAGKEVDMFKAKSDAVINAFNALTKRLDSLLKSATSGGEEAVEAAITPDQVKQAILDSLAQAMNPTTV